MASTPPNPEPAREERPPGSRLSLGALAALSPLRRELIAVGAALAFGILVMPFLIWFGGNRVLGPYTHGDDLKAGPGALFADYVVALVHGSAVFWGVALGPLVLLLLVQGFLTLLRTVPQLRRGSPPASPPRPERPPQRPQVGQ
ncbi:MAG TPA: hypothetical protein VGR80_10220 [Steroidobacteraceae bacterium]|nr:hypothetical protein [Gammaproteobacteria bacterium]HEV2286409.1 hypothetical protein [Steroidobacteraceae bacterium]